MTKGINDLLRPPQQLPCATNRRHSWRCWAALNVVNRWIFSWWEMRASDESARRLRDPTFKKTLALCTTV